MKRALVGLGAAATGAAIVIACGSAPSNPQFGEMLFPLYEEEPDAAEEEEDEDAAAEDALAPAVRLNGCANHGSARPLRKASGCHQSRDCLRSGRRSRCVNGARTGHPGLNTCVSDACLRDEDCGGGRVCHCDDDRGNRCAAP